MQGLPLTLVCSLALALLSCADSRQGEPASGPPDDVALWVSGQPIREQEVTMALRGGGHGGEDAARRETVLATLTRRELRAQEAVRLGLDPGEVWRARQAELDAQAAIHRRDGLADAWAAARLTPEPTEAEVLAWLEANAERVRTEVHVEQILFKGEAGIDEVQRRLAAGEPFEGVAASRFPVLPPAAGRPWDLGWLGWAQLPDAWHAPLSAMEIGAVSDPIRGPGGRAWIVRLVDRRVRPDTDLATARPAAEAILRRQKAAELEARLDAELRAAAGLPPP